MEISIIVYKTWNKRYDFGVQVNLGKLGLVESVGVLNQANFNKNLHIERGNLSMSKKAFKIASAAAVAASAFVAVNPAQAATASEAEVLVKKAESLGGTLKWAISVEGSWDGHSNPDMKLFNDTKAAHAKAVAAVSTLKGAQKTALEARLNDKVKLYVDRAVTVIDAVSAGKKIEGKKMALETQLDASKIDAATVKAYDDLSSEIRKQESLLSRVYGQTSRASIRDYYQESAEVVKEEAKYPVSVFVELGRLDAAITAKNEAEATTRYNNISAWLPKVDNATMKAELQAKFDAKKSAYEAIKTPKVESVSAINAKQMVIKFNQEMDASTLVDSSNGYVLKNITFAGTTSSADVVTSGTATGSLSADKKSLTVTLAGSETFEGTYAVTVDADAKTKAGKSLKDYSGTFEISDKVAPTVVGVTATTNTNVATTATVSFSEPITAAVVKIDGVVYTPASGLGTEDLNFTGLALDASKTHTVEVINASDAKSNIKALQTTSFSVNKDTVAPAASFEAVGDHQILVTFTKDMTVSSVTTSAIKVVEEDLTALTATTEYTVSQVGTSKKQFLVNVSKGLYGSKNERTLTVQINNTAKDLLGNQTGVTTQNVKLSKDVTAPTIQNAEVINDTAGNASKVRFTFSEELAAVPANLNAVSAMNAVTGQTEVVANLLDAATLSLLPDGKTVEVGVKPTALGKKVNLVIASGFATDVAQTANNSSAFSKVVEFKAAAGAFSISQASLTTTTPNTIVVAFGQQVVGDFGTNAANNPANYTIAGQSLPVGTSIVINANRDEATIVLPAEFVAKTDASAVFTVNNVKSLGGTTITPFVGFANTKDNVTPKLDKVVWNTNGSLTLDFSEAIATGLTGTEAGVEVKLNGGTYTLAASDYTFAAGTGSDAGNIVATFVVGTDATHGSYIELGNDTVYNAGTDVLVADIVNVSVKTLATSGIQDAAGNDAKANTTVSASK